MRLREINLGCFGGGTGLPSLLGGLKRNPWLRLNAVVTMFDSGGSSGQLRDELGVLDDDAGGQRVGDEVHTVEEQEALDLAVRDGAVARDDGVLPARDPRGHGRRDVWYHSARR